MCVPGGRSTPAPLIQATPDPLPPPPTPADPAVAQSRRGARRRAAAAQGREDTILGGQIRTAPQNQPLKTLLGQ